MQILTQKDPISMRFKRRRYLEILTSLTARFVGPLAKRMPGNQMYEPGVQSVQIPIPGLHESLEGFRLLVLSDFHISPSVPVEYLRKVATLANRLKPDLVVFPGDFVWHEAEAIYDLAPVLATIDSRHGSFACLGNHDTWTDKEIVQQGLEKSGIRLLVDQGVTFQQGKGTLNLIGLDDGWEEDLHLDQALDGLPAQVPTILLLHEPDLADEVAADGRVALQLAGHTHGGQIRIDGRALVLPPLGRKYDYGLHPVGQMHVYTSAGIGTTTIPLRLNCPPEISEITIISEDPMGRR
jgi:hypothetical protein